ncbi:phosphotransferase family protein [Roseomonas stagni]|uniref:Phosphotransferase family protein n=1 Tax=Falsiroseomonas algicola TaxID=2716930 RepID=A0A6M1LPQ3_9PROT|nr:phosphotransferase family protein [Falsiroseomonas algicola]NGM22123.1 phosphotransferase family protein [Falsiroseomonas algicola]
MDEAALCGWLRRATGDEALRITALTRLSGGAIQQNWALDVETAEGARRWVLRTDAPAVLAVSLPRAAEFALLRAAREAGVTVAEPIFLCEDMGVIGRPFFVMGRVEGIAAAHRVVKQAAPHGDEVVAALGRELARIHRIRPPRADLTFLGDPPADAARAMIAAMRARLDEAGTPRPVLEWGLRALERTAPPPVAPVLCHHDFRTGNVMIDGARVAAVLDWEFAAWGDPHADLGWFCAKCWRFGAHAREAGGIGAREAFYAGYESEAGTRIDRARMPWWELMATIRWAVIAADQAARHLSGQERSLELALTGHIVPELELDVLAMTEAL